MKRSLFLALLLPASALAQQHHLFLDPAFITESQGTALHVNPPRRREVVIRPDKPWEQLMISFYCSVLDDGGKLRLWYICRDKANRPNVAYAESADGVNWIKPNLGIVEHDGNMQNNLVGLSSLEGTVYRITPLKEVVEFASDLGIATGLAFNRDSEMFVGDRSGTIYRVNEIGEARVWATLEPSVSAYHLAFGPDGFLYVTGPTVCSFDAIMRFNEDGEPSVFFRGLGRPQGLAFDRDGNLYVAASLRGRRGIVRISRDGGHAEVVVAGMNLVGLAFAASGEMVLTTNDSVYSLPLGIQGTLLD